MSDTDRDGTPQAVTAVRTSATGPGTAVQTSLFPELVPPYSDVLGLHTTGVLPRQDLARFVADGVIDAAVPITDGQLQPASLDLRLGAVAHRVPASFLPGPSRTVREQIDRLAMHTLDLGQGACLEAGCTYIVPLEESLRLPADFSGIATPKSTTGRLDVFTRLLTDGAAAFEHVAERYTGPLYVEVSPRTFSIVARRGDCLNQLRLRRGRPRPATRFHERIHEQEPLVFGEDAAVIEDAGLLLSVDLRGDAHGEPVAYRAKRHARAPIDLRRIGEYDPATFWEIIPGPLDDGLILRPDEFYIMATKERVRVPRTVSAEMVAYDTAMGEFRVHYAGFFDPGFGDHEPDPAAGLAAGTRAVLEVRSHDTPVLLEDGQRIGRLVYERLTRAPDVLYGRDLASNYARQGVTLAKQFRRG